MVDQADGKHFEESLTQQKLPSASQDSTDNDSHVISGPCRAAFYFIMAWGGCWPHNDYIFMFDWLQLIRFFPLLLRNQAEMAHTCRGTINLANALIHTEDSTTIVISNGGAQTFHLKATSEVERQKWVTALELAKSEAIKMLEAGEFLCFCF